MKAQSPTKEIISFLKKRRHFTLENAVRVTGLDRRKALRVLEKLRREGFLILVSETSIAPRGKEVGPYRRNPKYERIRDLSARKPNRPENDRDKIWRTLRILRKATRSDLIRLSGCSLSTAERYTIMLFKNGYLKEVGKRNKEKIWLLVKDPGPQKPRIEEAF